MNYSAQWNAYECRAAFDPADDRFTFIENGVQKLFGWSRGAGVTAICADAGKNAARTYIRKNDFISKPIP
ncbi:hypothetical protein P421_10895 [Heyndrickxia coagulans P38]|nr:hypothetical protein P421_10895 [Heyndrickxia coagulans P38]